MLIPLVPVPPPKEVPVDQISETLGLLPGLKAEKRNNGWRCANCDSWQGGRTWLVWVPDSVRVTDSAASISDQCRCNSYNGSGSGWCLKCAKSLGKKFGVRKFLGLIFGD